MVFSMAQLMAENNDFYAMCVKDMCVLYDGERVDGEQNPGPFTVVQYLK